MGTGFDSVLHRVRTAFLALLKVAQAPVDGPDTPNEPGVYVLYEECRAMYVGRTGDKKTAGLRNRLKRHYTGSPRQAPLAKHLAEERLAEKGIGPMKKDELNQTEEFRAAKERVRAMSARWVVERDADCRCLLEFYAAKELRTPYNDFAET